MAPMQQQSNKFPASFNANTSTRTHHTFSLAIKQSDSKSIDRDSFKHLSMIRLISIPRSLILRNVKERWKKSPNSE